MIFLQTHSTKSRCVIGPERTLFLSDVRATVGPEILQAAAVEGLTKFNNKENVLKSG